jgi:hypothetical protein
MAVIHKQECEAAGIDIADVERIAKGISRYAKEAKKYGICVFSGSGDGTLRFNDGGNGSLILADLDGDFDGGDGATKEDDEDGLMRGEY